MTIYGKPCKGVLVFGLTLDCNGVFAIKAYSVTLDCNGVFAIKAFLAIAPATNVACCSIDRNVTSMSAGLRAP